MIGDAFAELVLVTSERVLLSPDIFAFALVWRMVTMAVEVDCRLEASDVMCVLGRLVVLETPDCNLEMSRQ